MSFVAWLRAQAKMTRRSAQRLRTLAVRLRSLPVCAEAYADGSLSGGQIEAILARVDDNNVEIFAAQEAELVPYLIPMTVAGVSRAMGYWLARNRPEPSEPKEPERSLYMSKTLDDRWILNGSLDAEGGSVVATALRLATPDKTDLLANPSTRRASALVDICRFFLDHQQTHAGGRHRPYVNVVVELDDLEAGRGGRVVDGPALDGPTVARLFCDSAVPRVVMRRPLGHPGLRHRHPHHPGPALERPGHPRRALPLPGCDRPSVWCEGHHVTWVTQGGPTELANLVLLCSRHHHVLHQPGWHAKLRPDGGFEVTDPDGIVRETSPPRAELLW